MCFLLACSLYSSPVYYRTTGLCSNNELTILQQELTTRSYGRVLQYPSTSPFTPTRREATRPKEPVYLVQGKEY